MVASGHIEDEFLSMTGAYPVILNAIHRVILGLFLGGGSDILHLLLCHYQIHLVPCLLILLMIHTAGVIRHRMNQISETISPHAMNFPLKSTATGDCGC
jgi:hypothetical protein